MSTKEINRQEALRLGLDGRPTNNLKSKIRTNGKIDNLVRINNGIYLTPEGYHQYSEGYKRHKKEPVSLEKIKEEYRKITLFRENAELWLNRVLVNG